MKIYLLKGCRVTKYLGYEDKYYKDDVFGSFLKKEDAKKAIKFYENREEDYKGWIVTFEDMEIETYDVYDTYKGFEDDVNSIYEEFKMDMEGDI